MKNYTRIVVWPIVAMILAICLYACGEAVSNVAPAPATPDEKAVASEVVKDGQTIADLADVVSLKTQADVDKQEALIKSERAANVALIAHLKAQILAAGKLNGELIDANTQVEKRSVQIVQESRAAKVEVFAWVVLVLGVICGVGSFLFPAYLAAIPIVSKIQPYLLKSAYVLGGLSMLSFFAADYVADWVWIGWLIVLGGIAGAVYHYHNEIKAFVATHSDLLAKAENAVKSAEAKIEGIVSNHAAELAKANQVIAAVKSSAVDEINKIRNVAKEVVVGIDAHGQPVATVVKK